jgi:hypothetical protein
MVLLVGDEDDVELLEFVGLLLWGFGKHGCDFAATAWGWWIRKISCMKLHSI